MRGSKEHLIHVAGLLLAATLVAIGTSGCTIGDPEGGEAEQTSETSSTKESEPAKISVKDGSSDVDVLKPITVNSVEPLKQVELTNDSGKVVEAEFSSDRREWKTSEPLGYYRTYTLKVTEANQKTSTTTFSTVNPQATTSVSLSPIPDSTVGVGQSIDFIFSYAPDDREAVENAITIKTSNDTKGGFYWIEPGLLKWRPYEFWEPGTTVSVDAKIYGLDLGNGVYGASSNQTNFTIGDNVQAVVDDATKTMQVYRNGELLRSIPVSLGRDTARWATPNGTYVVGDEYPQLLMDSETFGLPVEDGGYETMVDYATQLSYSGIYVHAAPWSVAQQGYSNSSHGCINVTTEAAAWFQQTVKRGDPVIVKNTVGGTMSGYDGLGQWNIDANTWREGNA